LSNPQYLIFSLKKLSIEELMAKLEFPFTVGPPLLALTDTADTRFQINEPNFARKIAAHELYCGCTHFNQRTREGKPRSPFAACTAIEEQKKGSSTSKIRADRSSVLRLKHSIIDVVKSCIHSLLSGVVAACRVALQHACNRDVFLCPIKVLFMSFMHLR
jgi:hypothetical protein